MKLQEHRLTFIAEDLGKRNPPPLSWLKLLAAHKSPIVREGAIYGLARHVENSRVRDILFALARYDVDPAVANAAWEALH